MLGNFLCFCCRLLTFFRINFFKRFFQEQIRGSNDLDPDQDVCPDLGPNCLQRLSCFCCRLLTFSKLTFSKDSFRITIGVSNGLDPDQNQHFVGPGLGPNYFQRLSADNKSHL